MKDSQSHRCDRCADALSVGLDAEPSGRPARSIYSLLASAWFYGGWKAETKTERDMQAIMEAEGWWPIRGEGDLFTRIGKEMLSASPASPAHAELSPGNSSDLRGEEG